MCIFVGSFVRKRGDFRRRLCRLDCGLLRRLARLAPEVVLSGNEQYKEFRGAMAENMVLQALVPQLDGVPYYWTSGNQAEIEFLIEHIDQVIPVEVKSATRISGEKIYNAQGALVK